MVWVSSNHCQAGESGKMTTLALRPTELRIPAPELRGVAYELGACRDPEVCLEGKAGTGKTVGICFKVHMQHLMYPGLRGLMARKYMTDLTASAVQTYRALLRPEERVQ